MSKQIISAEFTKSLLKAIENQSTIHSVSPEDAIICIDLNTHDEVGFSFNKNEEEMGLIRAICALQMDDLIFLNPIYSMFKGQIPGALKSALVGLRGEDLSVTVRVLISKSKAKENDLRVCLYLRHVYDRDITIGELI